MVDTHLLYEREPDEIAKLKMKPIAMPTLGHLQMLPLNTEMILVDLEAHMKGDTAIHGMSMNKTFMENLVEQIAEHGPDRWTGYECLIYCLPDGYEGPLS